MHRYMFSAATAAQRPEIQPRFATPRHGDASRRSRFRDLERVGEPPEIGSLRGVYGRYV